MDKIDKLIESQTEYIASLYRDIETEIIYSIVEMMYNKGITPTGELKLAKLLQMGVLDRETVEYISNITGVQLDDIYESLKVVSNGSIDYDTLHNAYDMKLTNVLASDVSLSSVLKQANTNINKEMKLIQTTVVEYANRDFRRTLDKVMLETKLGTMTNDQAMTKAIKEMATKGVTAATYIRNKGEPNEKVVEMGLEPYVRRVIQTEYVQMVAKNNELVGEELGAEHYYVTQHFGARSKGIGYENHSLWQGKVYTKEELYTRCGYGEMLGLSGINCRHVFRPFYKGVSFMPEPINLEENDRIYELTQRQRQLERYVRQSKRVIGALKRFPTEDTEEELKRENKRLRLRQQRLRKLIEDSNGDLKRDYTREKVIE